MCELILYIKAKNAPTCYQMKLFCFPLADFTAPPALLWIVFCVFKHDFEVF